MPVISVLAPSSFSGIQVCPCGLHANLFAIVLWKELGTPEICLTQIIAEEIVMSTEVKPQKYPC
jgi:hypothetical protein